MTISTGGFSGDNALLAFAAVQQGRMNDELTESMRVADVRSQMAQDVASIKAHLDSANRVEPGATGVSTAAFIKLEAELQAFKDKYGTEPACADMMGPIGEVQLQVSAHIDRNHGRAEGAYAQPQIPALIEGVVKNLQDRMQETLDAAGTNDQLAMIHIKQLNDNMNNSSGMVSGILDSRQNTTASIINNLA